MSALKTSKTPCTCCGTADFIINYMDCPTKQRMDRDGLCFSCAFWSLKVDRSEKTVIDGAMYTPGNRTSGEFRGMAGRRFDIEYFDGRRITTYDLWSAGTIPDHFRDKIPDNARFLNGAERVQVGDTGCFNSSDERASAYPLPKDCPSAPSPASSTEAL